MFRINVIGFLGAALISLLSETPAAMGNENEKYVAPLSAAERAASYSFVWLADPKGKRPLDDKRVKELNAFFENQQISEFIYYPSLGTFLVPNSVREKLAERKDVDFEPDGVVHGFGSGCHDEEVYEFKTEVPYNESWGLKRVWSKEPDDFKDTRRAVWIVDSGVAPDLGDELDVVGRKDCTQRNCPDDKMKKWADRIGHGTVIAGIIGAKNNGKGIIGVAPGAKINSLRVTDGREALSNLSFVNNALTWLDDNVTNDNEPATPSPGDVVNLSLGLGWSPLTTSAQAGIELLVGKLADKGLKVSIAAGNIDTLDGQGYVQAISPARAGGYENTGSGGAVRTASGIDANDEFWKFSAFGNFLLNTSGVQQKGPPDFAEPAADIISIWPGKELARCSGTSLAAAYLSGLLLWGKPKDGGPVKSDPSALEPGSAASAPVYDPTRAEPIGVMQ